MIHQKQCGFTLIELMITLILVAILLALAAPSFQGTIERRRLDGAAENLFSDLQFARSEAIKQNQAVQFQFNSGVWCYGVDDDGANCDCTAPASCTINTIQKVVNSTAYVNVTFAAEADFVGTTINFDPRQGIPDDDGTFILTTPMGLSRRVCVNAIGRIRMVDGANACI